MGGSRLVGPADVLVYVHKSVWARGFLTGPGLTRLAIVAFLSVATLAQVWHSNLYPPTLPGAVVPRGRPPWVPAGSCHLARLGPLACGMRCRRHRWLQCFTLGVHRSPTLLGHRTCAPV